MDNNNYFNIDEETMEDIPMDDESMLEDDELIGELMDGEDIDDGAFDPAEL